MTSVTITGKKLRDWAFVRYNGLANYSGDIEDQKAVREYLDMQLEKAAGKSHYGYVKMKYEQFFKIHSKIPEIEKQLKQLHSKSCISLTNPLNDSI